MVISNRERESFCIIWSIHGKRRDKNNHIYLIQGEGTKYFISYSSRLKFVDLYLSVSPLLSLHYSCSLLFNLLLISISFFHLAHWTFLHRIRSAIHTPLPLFESQASKRGASFSNPYVRGCCAHFLAVRALHFLAVRCQWQTWLENPLLGCLLWTLANCVVLFLRPLFVFIRIVLWFWQNKVFLYTIDDLHCRHPIILCCLNKWSLMLVNHHMLAAKHFYWLWEHWLCRWSTRLHGFSSCFSKS